MDYGPPSVEKPLGALPVVHDRATPRAGDRRAGREPVDLADSGGQLTGESPARIGFLRKIIEQAPGGVLDPISSNQGFPVAGVQGEFYLEYYGFGQPIFREVTLPPGHEYQVDIIDTWNMTIDTLPGTYTGTFRVDLPGREFIALRMTSVDTDRPAPPTV